MGLFRLFLHYCVTELSEAVEIAINRNPNVTASEIAMELGISSRAIEKRIRILREKGVIRRIGGDRGGYWEVIVKDDVK